MYAGATGSAGIAWTGWGGLDALGDGRPLAAAWSIAVASIVWFVVAGIGLRLIRANERRRSFVGQSVD